MADFPEFPKRVYVGGKGFTINNAEEEEILLGKKKVEPPVEATPEPELVEESKPEENPHESKSHTHSHESHTKKPTHSTHKKKD